MRRIQIHIGEDLDEALAREAHARGVSKAALIREYLATHVKPTRARGADPTTGLVGSYDGEPDESARVGEVLYGS